MGVKALEAEGTMKVRAERKCLAGLRNGNSLAPRRWKERDTGDEGWSEGRSHGR